MIASVLDVLPLALSTSTVNVSDFVLAYRLFSCKQLKAGVISAVYTCATRHYHCS
jgi:hypothetical protein